MSWKGYDVTCVCRDNGLILKAGEVFGGRDRALDAIAKNEVNLQAASKESDVDKGTLEAIMYEEQSHLTPYELTLEQLFPDKFTGGQGAMQVSVGTAIRVRAD